ncbi:alpha/beta hydrolase fold domain-containing protein [Microvirga brassicacearum]|uniref:Alpha/beta hydrolase n=1 Tax=Microvirga brassicacearum TaxID=2580413 RepID=A0A5N3P7N9_9HYPH|nr:alpha/beta hydrolase fold domain-containing protein [Microvirga brassicacearum]KAB0265743.1 alpha/beta hydrolase [Microvirga brassicacearum]
MNDAAGLLPSALAPEMEALMLRVEREGGPQIDPTMLPAPQGRALSEESNRRWNRNFPAMAHVVDVLVPADHFLGSANCRMKVLVPPDAGAGAILFVHGGGFAFCSPDSHERCARVLAIESGLPVLLPDYRLAPERPFPAGLLDVVGCLRAAFRATKALEVSPGPLLVAGDSAGANLALAALLHEQEKGQSPASGALLFYGVYDANFDTLSYRHFADGPGLTRGKMQRYWNWYAGESARRDNPLMAPFRASDAALQKLPPLYLMAAGIDPLLSDSLNLAARLKSLDRPEKVVVVPGVVHGFLQMSNELPAARQALARAGSAARAMATIAN